MRFGGYTKGPKVTPKGNKGYSNGTKKTPMVPGNYTKGCMATQACQRYSKGPKRQRANHNGQRAAQSAEELPQVLIVHLRSYSVVIHKCIN